MNQDLFLQKVVCGMDRIKKLSEVFTYLSELDGDFFDSSECFTVSLYIKRLFVLASLFYPDCIRKYEPRVYRMGTLGELWNGMMEVDIEEDIMPQYEAYHSDAVDYLLAYYQESPYWEVYCDCLCFDDMLDESEMPIVEFFKSRSNVFEQKLLDSLKEDDIKHPLKTYYDLFEESGDYSADDCVILKSKLLPHYYNAKRRFLKEDQYLCSHVKMCVNKLIRWLSGYSYAIEDKNYDYAYYISCDNSSYWYDGGYGNGVLDHRLEILVSGEIIDRCILELDKKYAFLPADLKSIEVVGG